MKKLASFLILMTVLLNLHAEEIFRAHLNAEAGFLGVFAHTIQAGPDSDRGDVFNYVTQGNQDILFNYNRFQADLEFFHRHHFILLYQPLTIQTQATIDSNFRYNADDYATTDGFLELIYGFDFWRFSYLYDIVDPPEFFFSLGLSLQIRNASIVFRTTENSVGSVEDNIGPVPIIKTRLGYESESGFFLLFEGDGFYASSEIFNGAQYPFVGYIYDLSLRFGYHFSEPITAFINIRFLGGGATGTNAAGQYTNNDLHTMGVSLGLTLHL